VGVGESVAVPVAIGRKAGSLVAVSVGRNRGASGADREQALTASNVIRMATDKALRERRCERVGMALFYRRCRRQSLPKVTVSCGEFRCKIKKTSPSVVPPFSKVVPFGDDIWVVRGRGQNRGKEIACSCHSQNRINVTSIFPKKG